MRVFSPFVLEMLRGKHCLICFLLPATTNHTTKKSKTKKKTQVIPEKTSTKKNTVHTRKNKKHQCIPQKKHESYQKKAQKKHNSYHKKNRIHTRKNTKKKHKSYHQKSTKKNTIHTTKKGTKKTKKGIFLFVSASVSAFFLLLFWRCALDIWVGKIVKRKCMGASAVSPTFHFL